MKQDPLHWHKNKLPKLEVFFNQISVVIEDFANTHNLLIVKYPHRSSYWSLMFRHPKGGYAQIAIGKWGNERIEIVSDWCFNDFKKLRSFIKRSNKKRIPIDSTKLSDLLYTMLNDVLSWKIEDLRAMHGIHYEWKEVGRKQFEKGLERYPFPKIE